MYDENIRYYERYLFNETVIDPFAFGFLIIMIFLVFCLPRRYCIFPIVATMCFITSLQRIVILGLDFDYVRILLAVGGFRVITFSEYRLFKINKVDKILICWVIISIITYTLLRKEISALINRLGWGYDIVGIYFLTRVLLKDLDDIERLIRFILIISIPIAFAMLIEQIEGHNYFSLFGGVPEFNIVRDGKIRSQGAFSHPILAGCFGAAILPLILGLRWRSYQNNFILIIGIISATAITISSSSSGPLLSYLSGVLCLCLWRFRKKIKAIIFSGFLFIIGLHFLMKDPVWALIWRLIPVKASDGYHRYMIIDQAINRVNEWWLFGTKTTIHWGWGLQDITNMYVRIGVNGGIISLLLFLLLICVSLINLDKSIRLAEIEPSISKFIWAIGASFFAQIVSFMGVSYFGQMFFFWNMILALISTIGSIDMDSELHFNSTALAK